MLVMVKLDQAIKQQRTLSRPLKENMIAQGHKTLKTPKIRDPSLLINSFYQWAGGNCEGNEGWNKDANLPFLFCAILTRT